MSYSIFYLRFYCFIFAFVQIIRTLEMYDNFPHWKFFGILIEFQIVKL